MEGLALRIGAAVQVDNSPSTAAILLYVPLAVHTQLAVTQERVAKVQKWRRAHPGARLRPWEVLAVARADGGKCFLI